jgi:hypothetical protein
MRTCRSNKALILGFVLFASQPRAARADDPVVHLDAELQRFDQRIPSSTPFVLEIKSAGSEVLRGEVEIWPTGDECTGAPTSERQHYTLAMTPSGSSPDRVLRATVPALQVDTHFCFRVRITHGLDEVRAIGFAARVTERVFSSDPATAPGEKLDVETTCQQPTRRATFADHITRAVASVSQQDLANARAALSRSAEATPPAAARGKGQAAEPRSEGLAERTVAPAALGPVRTASSGAIGKAVVDGLDLEALCRALDQASEAARASGPITGAATDQANAEAALDGLAAAPPITARLPLFVTGTPPGLEIRRYDQIPMQDAAIPAAAAALEALVPELAALLHEVEGAKPEAKAAPYAAYLAKLRALPRVPVVVAYVAGGSLFPASLDALFPGQRPGEPDADWAKRRALQRGIVLANLDLLKRQMAAFQNDDARAQVWFAALDALQRADQAARTAAAAQRAKLDAVDAARGAIAAKIRERLVSADARALVVNITSIQSQQTMKAPQTGEGVSSVSPDIGVLLAFPIYADTAHAGWEPWLVPYAGVNLYRQRVDRVVPFDQLVGSWWRQRMSLTLGALLTRPKINGVQISTPFRDSGLVPVLALGVRLTSFTRASIGGFVFDYQDVNPASVAKHHGGAIWFGLSIDADVWTTVAGKAFK